MKQKVERCLLAPDLSISRVLTGLWQIADMERDGGQLNLEETASAMEPYVETGLTTFDMADHYGSAEEIAGKFLRRCRSRDDVQLLTKWVPAPGPCSREDVRSAVRRSVDRMGTSRLDLLQFHAWNYADPTWLDCLFWLQELKEEGWIRHLGLTNFDTAHLRIAVQSGIRVVSNQVCFSLLDQRARHGMADFCLAHGIQLLAFGTVAGGFLTECWLDRPEPDWGELETWSQMKYRRFIEVVGGWQRLQKLLRVVKEVALRHGVSMANVACRYILEQPAVGGIIVGARLGRSGHIEDNLRLFQFELGPESRKELETALTELLPVPGDCGDEYRKAPFLTASGDLSHHLQTIPPPYASRIGPDERMRVFSGTPWEPVAGYCRAIRQGRQVWVSGTTAAHGSRLIGGSDPAAQLHFVIDKIEGALQSLGGSLQDIVRTRLFVPQIRHWEVLARVHGERFRDIQPANTLVETRLVGDEFLVEMEAEAILQERD